MKELKNYLEAIKGPDQEAISEAGNHWYGVCKPLGSLGILEDLVCKLAGIQKTKDVCIDKRCVLVVCADNGVVEEKVTQSESIISSQVAREIADGKSNINIMAEKAGADTIGVDVGLAYDVEHPNLIQRKIAYGTANFAKKEAMSEKQAVDAIKIGIELVGEVKEKGYQLVVTGEMGIGNTTTASAIAAVLLGMPVKKVTGRGAGLTTEGLAHKKQVIEKALKYHNPNSEDPIDVLKKIGGFDIAAMTGIFLGGAIYGIPVVIDGFISSVAALLAYKLNPIAVDYMLASHMTEEPAGRMIMDELGLKPIIFANMRLGEGTGGVCLLPILDIAIAEYKNAHRFEETEVEQYVELL